MNINYLSLRKLTLLFFMISAYAQYSCENSKKINNNFHWRGTSLGGWLILEPWLTPSMFYQFLGASEKWGDEAKAKVAMDSYSFCTALGKEEANRQLRLHWKTWVTEEHISELSTMGVDTLRIPVADWMYIPYEPYVGCWDGALEELKRVTELCHKYNLNIMLDLHAMKDSQNGLDNSGISADIVWTSNASSSGVTKFKHWDIRAGNWVGKFNHETNSYESINYDNINYSLDVVSKIVDIHKDDPAIVAFEPINEPIQYIPMDILKQFYWDSYQRVQAKASHWVTVFHDSFRLSPDNWKDFMVGCANYAFDAHIYQAWSDPVSISTFQKNACHDGHPLQIIEKLGIPVIVGEWSLAIDNCAMWINGINDNVYGYPKAKCEMVTCPEPYMGSGMQPGAPPDPSKGPQDPFGTGESFVWYGQCPRDQYLPDEDHVMRRLAMSKLHAFDLYTHGQFFWNFRTEFEPRWDYMEAVRRGWLPRSWSRGSSEREKQREIGEEERKKHQNDHPEQQQQQQHDSNGGSGDSSSSDYSNYEQQYQSMRGKGEHEGMGGGGGIGVISSTKRHIPFPGGSGSDSMTADERSGVSAGGGGSLTHGGGAGGGGGLQIGSKGSIVVGDKSATGAIGATTGGGGSFQPGGAGGGGGLQTGAVGSTTSTGNGHPLGGEAGLTMGGGGGGGREYHTNGSKPVTGIQDEGDGGLQFIDKKGLTMGGGGGILTDKWSAGGGGGVQTGAESGTKEGFGEPAMDYISSIPPLLLQEILACCANYSIVEVPVTAAVTIEESSSIFAINEVKTSEKFAIYLLLLCIIIAAIILVVNFVMKYFTKSKSGYQPIGSSSSKVNSKNIPKYTVEYHPVRFSVSKSTERV